MNILQKRKTIFSIFLIIPFVLKSDATHSGINIMNLDEKSSMKEQKNIQKDFAEFDKTAKSISQEARKKQDDTISIITISGQEVMTLSQTGQDLNKKMQREQDKLTEPLKKDEEAVKKDEKSLMKEQESLQKDFAEFEKTAKTMSQEAREKKQAELQDKAIKFDDNKRRFERDVAKLNAEGQKVQTKLSETYQKEMTKLDAFVKATIKEEAEKNKWDLVLMEESIMYASPKISKTKLIIEKLDAKTKAQNLAKKEAIEKANSKNT